MSSSATQKGTNIVAFLVFLGITALATYATQKLFFEPQFRSLMIGFFAPEGEIKTEAMNASKGDQVIHPGEFILDMSDKTEGVSEGEPVYTKGSGQWIIQGEKLGEEPIIIDPWMTFGILSAFIGFIIAVLLTAMIPGLGYIHGKIKREIGHTIDKIDEQTGDKISREEIVRITAANAKDDLTAIEKEFGPVVVDEIEDVRAANQWKKTPFLVFKGLRLYMTRHFAEKYSNNVQGFAYGGAAILIVIIGIRGLKFIPPTQPSVLLAAITLEFAMLSLLAVTLFYTEEEQRMDKLIRDLEESSEGQKFELINLVRTSQQQQRDLASMVDYIQRQTGDLKRMADALTGANKEYIIQVAQRAVAEYITQERSEEITERVIRERIESAMRQMFAGGAPGAPNENSIGGSDDEGI